MKTKKHPKANLENYSKLFAQLGLVLTLTIVYVLIQNKTFAKEIAIVDHTNQGMVDNVEINVEYKIEPPKEKPVKKKVIIDVVEQVDNDKEIGEVFFEDIDPEAPIDVSQLVDVTPEEKIIEDVPFPLVEHAPAFPGCEGTKEEMKACFTNKIRKFVSKKFNSELASTLGLATGTQKIFVVFKIDKTGDIVDIKARAPHIRLQDEAIRVINLLPQMKPGMQQNSPVSVKYSLPIAFQVE